MDKWMNSYASLWAMWQFIYCEVHRLSNLSVRLLLRIGELLLCFFIEYIHLVVLSWMREVSTEIIPSLHINQCYFFQITTFFIISITWVFVLTIQHDRPNPFPNNFCFPICSYFLLYVIQLLCEYWSAPTVPSKD